MTVELVDAVRELWDRVVTGTRWTRTSTTPRYGDRMSGLSRREALEHLG